jgi:hypothetical protein
MVLYSTACMKEGTIVKDISWMETMGDSSARCTNGSKIPLTYDLKRPILEIRTLDADVKGRMTSMLDKRVWIKCDESVIAKRGTMLGSTILKHNRKKKTHH